MKNVFLKKWFWTNSSTELWTHCELSEYCSFARPVGLWGRGVDVASGASVATTARRFEFIRTVSFNLVLSFSKFWKSTTLWGGKLRGAGIEEGGFRGCFSRGCCAQVPEGASLELERFEREGTKKQKHHFIFMKLMHYKFYRYISCSEDPTTNSESTNPFTNLLTKQIVFDKEKRSIMHKQTKQA